MAETSWNCELLCKASTAENLYASLNEVFLEDEIYASLERDVHKDIKEPIYLRISSLPLTKQINDEKENNSNTLKPIAFRNKCTFKDSEISEQNSSLYEYVYQHDTDKTRCIGRNILIDDILSVNGSGNTGKFMPLESKGNSDYKSYPGYDNPHYVCMNKPDLQTERTMYGDNVNCDEQENIYASINEILEVKERRKRLTTTRGRKWASFDNSSLSSKNDLMDEGKSRRYSADDFSVINSLPRTQNNNDHSGKHCSMFANRRSLIDERESLCPLRKQIDFFQNQKRKQTFYSSNQMKNFQGDNTSSDNYRQDELKDRNLNLNLNERLQSLKPLDDIDENCDIDLLEGENIDTLINKQNCNYQKKKLCRAQGRHSLTGDISLFSNNVSPDVINPSFKVSHTELV